jgi:alginate O-acetyltransferase complex protein AlgI
MLFNSYPFVFLFFPLTLVAFFALTRLQVRAAAGFLGLASLFFYGWWSLQALPLLLGSICVNYALGRRLSWSHGHGRSKGVLILGLAANLGLLALFKYADFFISNANAALAFAGGAPWPWLHWALPVGISFYTFTQIAFLVDCWQGKVREPSFLNYLLFVTYFPHLIAGPVLHHAQMMPQFASPQTYRVQWDKVALGLVIFVLGLAKKVFVADPLGGYADLVFNAVPAGLALNPLMAWLGVLAYALQIYFDFSGYSDMAVGLSLCFGIVLPLNFDSPYQARSIIEFWRRWHISLSTFLRDYLYIPLGGNRHGPLRRHLNLMATMVLGGLWHGASWTFVLWGAVHGAMLVVNHLWRQTRLGTTFLGGRRWAMPAQLITFVLVCLAWVLFRADSLDTALQVYRSLAGEGGWTVRPFDGVETPSKKAHFYLLLLGALAVVWAMPTAPVLARRVVAWSTSGAAPRWRAPVTALLTLAGFAACAQRFGQHSPFLYFQF